MTLQPKAGRTIRLRNDKRVTFNVSGRRFSTWESTLKRHPDTLLGSEGIKLFFDDERKEYFLDRDPHMFRFILNFYQVGRLHLSFDDCVCSFQDELRFYGIQLHEVGDCCWEECFKLNKNLDKNEHKDAAPVCHLHGRKRTLDVRLRHWFWNLLENSQTSRLGTWIQSFIGILIYVSIISTVAETVSCEEGKTCETKYPQVFFALDAFCISVFTVDYLLRLYAAENRKKFAIQKLNIIDLLAVLPFYVVLGVKHLTQASSSTLEDANTLLIMRIFRVFRIFKLSRHSKHLQKLATALQRTIVDLGFLFFAFGLANILFASVLYFVERSDNEKFDSIPGSMWYTIITMMTVGYGDIVPTTILGKLIGSVCCLMGIIMLALPIPIIQEGTNED